MRVCCQHIYSLMDIHKPGLDGDREIARREGQQKSKSWMNKCKKFPGKVNCFGDATNRKCLKSPTLGAVMCAQAL